MALKVTPFVNKGRTQGSVGGPYLFNVFLNDLHPTGLDNVFLTKFADDSSLVITVNEQSDNLEPVHAFFRDN